MFKGISAELTDKLINLKTINPEDREIYEFGIRHIFVTILNIFTVFIIGLTLDMTKEAMFFILSFIPLRIFAGGFHFNTPMKCYIFSSCFIAAVLLAMRYYSIPLLIYCILYCISSALILIFAPVEDKNKPLEQIEKKVYRKRTIIVFLTETIIVLALYLLKIEFAVQSIMASTISLSLLIVMGIIKNSMTHVK